MENDFQLDGRGNATAATMFLMIHHALRRELGRFPKALDILDPLDVQQAALLAEHWRLFCWVLTDHSENEDNVLFPLVLSRAAELAPVLKEIELEHEALDAQMAAVSEHMENLSTPAAISSARTASAEFAVSLGRHLDLEERHIVPTLVERIEPSELAPGEGENDKEDLDEPPMWLVVTWSEEGVPSEVSKAVVAGLPPHFQAHMNQVLPEWRAEYQDLIARIWRGVI
ncbi:hemerythrin domain-containing protein [Streptomyces sp. CT34]|uniref:hemerythrin domain-containing protein n=1 Tax=Streptomyces sp. CT34 TaxID=1553907 RepID=UPI0005BC8274|nr:hemerythrin domain-containing protein [Streptomyces sp. CT34]